MEPTTIMFIAPMKRNDPTTYTHQWATKAITMAKRLGYKVVELHGDNVNYKNVNATIERFRPRLFVTFSHGCPSSINGQNECVVTRKYSIDEMLSMEPEKLDRILNPVKLSGCGKNMCQLQNDTCSPLCFNDTNIHLLKDSIVYAVSCHTTEQLGRCAIQYGVQSYIGYDDLLLFPVDSVKSQDLFGEIQLKMLEGMLLGKSVGESYNDTLSLADAYIRTYKQTKWIGLPLLWNRLHMEALGNREARIYS